MKRKEGKKIMEMQTFMSIAGLANQFPDPTETNWSPKGAVATISLGPDD